MRKLKYLWSPTLPAATLGFTGPREAPTDGNGHVGVGEL